MPNSKSVIKRVKVIAKKTLNNNRIKSAYKTAVKKCELALEKGEDNIALLFNEAKKQIDQACSKGVISKNAANRKKSRLARKLNKKGVELKKVEVKEKKVIVKEEKKTTTKKTKIETKAKTEKVAKTTTKKATKKETDKE